MLCKHANQLYMQPSTNIHREREVYSFKRDSLPKKLTSFTQLHVAPNLYDLPFAKQIKRYFEEWKSKWSNVDLDPTDFHCMDKKDRKILETSWKDPRKSFERFSTDLRKILETFTKHLCVKEKKDSQTGLERIGWVNKYRKFIGVRKVRRSLVIQLNSSLVSDVYAKRQ